MPFIKSIKPSHLGLLTIHMWIYCTTHRSVPTGDVSIMTVMYLFLSAFLLCLLLGARKNAVPQKLKKYVDITGGIFMAIAAFFLTLPLPISGAATTFVASALGGIGVAWAYMRWGELYAEFEIKYATPLIFLTMALGSLGKTVVDLLPDIPAAIILVCLPLITYVSLYQASKSKPTATNPYRYYNNRTVRSLWRLALGIAVYSFTVGIIQSMSFEATAAPYVNFVLVKHGGEIILSLALFFWVVFFKRGISFSKTWRLVLLLMATALIFMPYLQGIESSYLFACIGIAQTFLIVLLFLALADIARHSTYHPVLIFAGGWITYTLPFALGDIIGTSLQTIESNAPIIMAAVVWILVIVTLFFLDESSMGKRLIFTELNDGNEEDTPIKRIEGLQKELDEQDAAKEQDLVDPLVARCKLLADELRLTPRELEILEQLARGRTKTYIADAFFISENTVRGHVKRLYLKLDVHNKQELVDRVESVSL